MTQQILLSSGHVSFVDDDDYTLASSRVWHLKKNTTSNSERLYVRSNNVGGVAATYLHRLICNCQKSDVVDHIDGNGLNNTKANLRVCTQAENSRNRRAQTPNVNGYRGVSFHPYCYNKGRKWDRKKKWAANICFNGKRMTRGYFETPIEAARFYDLLATKFFGEFASLNFPGEGLL